MSDKTLHEAATDFTEACWDLAWAFWEQRDYLLTYCAGVACGAVGLCLIQLWFGG